MDIRVAGDGRYGSPHTWYPTSPGENKLLRELKDVAAKRPFFQTIATQGQGVVERLDGLFAG